MNEGALTFMARAAIDAALAERQHDAYRTAVAATGTLLIDAGAEDSFPDATFVEDVLLAFPECFVLSRPGTASREHEPETIMRYLPNDRPVMSIKTPATLDGGDVLQIGGEVFVGLSSRSNEAAVMMLRALLAPHGYTVAPVRVAGSLHLKTAVTAPTRDILIVNPAWVDIEPFGNRNVLEVDPSEPFAGNTLRVGDRLFMQEAHPKTAARLRATGLQVDLIDISEFAKSEAGLTCMSVIVPPVQ